ncbi:MAG: arginine--tRNA ligase, partial [Dermatophilaceae bacterium]
MVSPSEVLAPRITAAIAAAFGDEHRDADPVLRPSQFADLQANAALALAKRLGIRPRDAAQRIVAALDVSDVCRQVEISGPGFVNLTLDEGWIARAAGQVAADARLGVALEEPLSIPIDYSSPNVAKEMHVGHLRTTVVGDALARTLEHLGHRVIRQNHVGDWGTPFGMLIEHLLDVGVDSPQAMLLETDPNTFFQAARAKFDTDATFADRARARVVALQSGDQQTLRLWERLIELSKHYFNRIYAALDVTLTDGDLAGESSFNADLPVLCDELESRGIAVESDGALCVFLDEFTGRDGTPAPLIIRKSGGGYNYATTDLAMIRRCVRDFHADKVVYVVGAPQALHFQMVVATARKAGWLPERVTPVHVQIGNVLGADRKLLRTRSGAPPRLAMLLDEAVDNARRIIDEARPDLEEDVRAVVARQVGIGAVKYADLSVAHDSEYVFDLERMLSLTGNTAVYLQYAVARIRNIFRQGGLDPDEAGNGIRVAQPGERELALTLLEFGSVLAQVGRELEPHRLCGYLFDLAQTFSGFYESCPVLSAEGQARESRL